MLTAVVKIYPSPSHTQTHTHKLKRHYEVPSTCMITCNLRLIRLLQKMRLSHVRHLVVCGFVLISAFTSSLPASSRERQSSSEPPSASYRRVAALFIYPSGVSRAFRHICRGGGNLISCKFLGPSPRGSDAAERTR